MAKNISLEGTDKKKERTKQIFKTIKTNSLPTSTPTSSTAVPSSALKLTTRSQTKIENPKSKLNLANARKLTKTKDKLNRTLSGEEPKSNDSSASRLLSTATKLSNTSSTNNSIQSSSNSNVLTRTNNGELRNNRAKSFTPINLTSGTQLAAVLAEHKKLAAVGYQPDHEMIQKTIEVGTSNISQLNSPVNVSTSTNTTTTNHQTLLTNSYTNQLTNHKTKLTSSLNKQSSSLDDNKRQVDENNNELTAEERKRQLYLRSPYLAQALDSATNNSNSKPDMPDSMAYLLSRSAKAREPLAKTSKKQLIVKRKASAIRSDSLDSGTCSPTTERSYGSKMSSKKTALANNKLTTTSPTNSRNSDFARTYALNSSKSPAAIVSNKTGHGLVRSRSNTLVDLGSTLNSGQSSSASNSSSYALTTPNSILHRRPRSDYVNSKYSLLKSKSTHSLNKID